MWAGPQASRSLIWLAVKTYGPVSCQAGASLTEWLKHASPFDEFIRALP
jgi:hypothetical protein